jgi:hypothetical protein
VERAVERAAAAAGGGGDDSDYESEEPVTVRAIEKIYHRALVEERSAAKRAAAAKARGSGKSGKGRGRGQNGRNTRKPKKNENNCAEGGEQGGEGSAGGTTGHGHAECETAAGGTSSYTAGAGVDAGGETPAAGQASVSEAAAEGAPLPADEGTPPPTAQGAPPAAGAAFNVDALFAEAPVGGMPPPAGYSGFSVEIAPSRQAPRAGTGPSLATLLSAGVIGANSAMGAGRNDVLRADGVTSFDAGNLAAEGGPSPGGMPQNLDATALSTAVVNSLADAAAEGGRPSLNDENFEEGQRQSLHLATLLERDNPSFAALFETDAFKALATMTESGDPGGEPICDDLDTCSVCANLNMAPVTCRACGNACCLPCVIKSGKKKGGDTDNVKCLFGCGCTLATIDEIKAALEGGGPWRWHASVARNSLKRKARVAELEEKNDGLEETVRMLKARVVELGGSSDDDEGVAPPRSNFPSIP